MKRVQKVQKQLKRFSVDLMLVQAPVDLFYLTGLELSAGSLLITKERVDLVVDGRYFEKAKALSPFHVHRAGVGVLSSLLKKYKKIGFDGDATSFAAYTALQKELPQPEFVSLSKAIEKIRMIKEASEVKALQKAADLCVQGFDYVVSLLKTGVAEIAVAKALEIFWLQHGAQKLSFDPIIAFGKNSSMPHYRAKNERLERGMPVLIDIGVVVDGYASDMT